MNLLTIVDERGTLCYVCSGRLWTIHTHPYRVCTVTVHGTVPHFVFLFLFDELKIHVKCVCHSTCIMYLEAVSLGCVLEFSMDIM